MVDQWWKLIGRLAVPCYRDEIDFSEEARRVRWTEVGCLHVSTVFLCLNHNIFGDGPPLLFETMILGDGDDGYQVRCSTWEEAEKQHEEAVRVAIDWTRRADAAIQPVIRKRMGD